MVPDARNAVRGGPSAVGLPPGSVRPVDSGSDFDPRLKRRFVDASGTAVASPPLSPVALVDAERAGLQRSYDESQLDGDAAPASKGAPIRSGFLIFGADCAGLMLPALIAGHERFYMLTVTAITVLLFGAGRLYRPRLHLSVLDQVPSLVGRSGSAVMIVAAGIGVTAHSDRLNTFIELAAWGVLAQLVFRWFAYRVVRHARTRRWVGHRTLIIGGGLVGAQLAGTLSRRRGYGLRPVGFLDDDPLALPGDLDIPHLGGPRDLHDAIRRHNISVLVIAFMRAPEGALVDVLRECEGSGCQVFVVPRLYEIYSQEGLADHIGALPVVRMRRTGLHGFGRVLKRGIDVAVSSMALVVLSPVLLLAAICVRIEGGPGILFRQTRVGMGGVEFNLLKFRSLKPSDDQESLTVWNVARDWRIGKVGHILRRTSIDELPQLWNILRGDMSLVGPRPERPHFVEKFASEDPRYSHRHRVPSGLTGLAQVSGLRGDTSIRDRARYDNYYIENWSLWLDVKILLGTLREVFKARGR